MSHVSMELLCDFLERAEWLEDLDISWNNFRYANFRKLFQILASNRTLKTLNLSMNAILSSADQQTQGDFTVLSKEERLTLKMQ